MGHSTSLRSLLKTRFHPFAEARGFAVDARDQQRSTTFRRHSVDHVHTFDIQWAKDGSSRFVVNCGDDSLAGISEEKRACLIAEAAPHTAARMGRLYPGVTEGTEGWFRLDVPFPKKLFLLRSHYRPEIVVDSLLGMFSELETWWSAGRVGPHMHILRPYTDEANQSATDQRP